MAGNSSGSLTDILAVFYRPFVDGGEQCVRVLGGPWELSFCGVRCGGGQCLMCEAQARVSMRRCSIGGMGAKLCAKGEGKIFASDGVVAMHNASVSLSACCVEQTGMLKGAAARSVDDGQVVVSDTSFRFFRSCALSVCGRGRVRAERCVFRENRGAAFAAGPKVMDAQRIAAPHGAGHSEIRERFAHHSRGSRTRYWGNMGCADKLVSIGDERLEHDGPSNEEDEEEFGWLLREGLAPGPAARAWGTELHIRDCRIYGTAWPNVTRPGILKEGRNRYYVEHVA